MTDTQEASENENNDGDNETVRKEICNTEQENEKYSNHTNLGDPGKEFQLIVSAENVWPNFEFDWKIFQTIILHIICFKGKHKRCINSTHINSSKIV